MLRNLWYFQRFESWNGRTKCVLPRMNDLQNAVVVVAAAVVVLDDDSVGGSG